MSIGGVCVSSTSSSSAPAVEPRRRGAWTAARRGKGIRCSCVGGAAGGLAEDHYRTLRLRPGATRGEVKKAFRQLALMYHPDVRKESDSGVDFQRINVAYQMVMSNMREAEERLEYWRLKYGLSNEDLDKYMYYLKDDNDEWFELRRVKKPTD